MANIDIATALILQGLNIGKDTPKEILHDTVKPEIQRAFEEMLSLDTTIKVLYPDWILRL